VTHAQESTSSPAGRAPAAGGSAYDERLEALYADQADKVFRAAYRVTGNAADAEDVVQTVFLRLTRMPAGKLGPDAGGYLHRSAVNAALDVVRSRQRAGWVPLEPIERTALGASDAPDPEREQRSRQLRAHIRLALSRLSPRSAEVFALRYFEGLGNIEIAGLLGLSQGVVAVLLHRTRARLKKELVALEGELQ